MKKRKIVLSILIAVCTMFCLCGCSQKEPSINSNKNISKSDDKNKWKLTDSIKEKITESARKDAEKSTKGKGKRRKLIRKFEVFLYLFPTLFPTCYNYFSWE